MKEKKIKTDWVMATAIVLFFVAVLFVLMFFFSGCTKENKILTAYPAQVVNSSIVELRFIVTDDMSKNMTYSVYIDALRMAHGQCYNNTMFRINLSLDPNKNTRVLRIEANDDWGNLGSANVTVTTADVQAPVIQFIEIVSR